MKQRPSLKIDELTESELRTLAKNLLKSNLDDKDAVDYLEIIEERRARQEYEKLEGLLESPEIISLLSEYLIHLPEKESKKMIGRMNKLLRTNEDLDIHVRKLFTNAFIGELKQDDLDKFEALMEGALSPEDSFMRIWMTSRDIVGPTLVQSVGIFAIITYLQISGGLVITTQPFGMIVTSAILTLFFTLLAVFLGEIIKELLFNGIPSSSPRKRTKRLNQRLQEEISRVLNSINHRSSELKMSEELLEPAPDQEFTVFVDDVDTPSDEEDKGNNIQILGKLGSFFEA